TADSGIDALTHALEAYLAVDNRDFPLPPGETSLYQGRHALGECLAEKAIELVARHLPAAVADGRNLEAREGMHLAALIAGLAFSNIGVAVVAALGKRFVAAPPPSYRRAQRPLPPLPP